MSENELFGEEDILNHNPNRSFSVVCVSQQGGEVVMIQKRDFYQNMLDSEQTKKIIQFRNNQDKFNNLIQEYKQYIMNNYIENIKQVHNQEYLNSSNPDIKKSGLSELLPLNLNQNRLYRFKNGKEQESLIQYYLENSRYQRINLKRRVFEKANQATNMTDQANLLMNYIQNYKYTEPFGVVQIEFNRKKPQPRQQFLDKVKQLEEKQEKLKQVLRQIKLKESKQFLDQSKQKVRSMSHQNLINQRIIHTSLSELRRQSSVSSYYSTEQNEQVNKSISDIYKKERYIKKNASYSALRTSEDLYKYPTEQELQAQMNEASKQYKQRSISQLMTKNTISNDEDLSPQKTKVTEQDTIKNIRNDSSENNQIYRRGSASQDNQYNQNSINPQSEFKQALHKIIRSSQNYEKIATNKNGFPIRIKSQATQNDINGYKKLSSQIKKDNNVSNPVIFDLNQYKIPLIKNKINSRQRSVKY